MGLFFIFSVLTFLAVLAVYFIEQTFWKNGENDWVSLKLDGRMFVQSQKNWLIGCVMAIIFVVSLIIWAFVTLLFYKLKIEVNQYYSPIEIASSLEFSKAALGVLFGGLLCVFSIFIYKLSPETKLNYAHKFFGFGLLVLFMIGATPITVEEIIRSIRFGEAGVTFQLSSEDIGGNKSNLESIRAVYSSVNQRGNKVGKAGLSGGFNTLYYLPFLIGADLEYLSQYSPGQETETQKTILATISKSYQENIFPLLSCLAAIANETGDIKYVNEKLTVLKPVIRVLYVQSKKGFKDQKKLNVAGIDLVRKLRKQVSLTLGLIGADVLNHSEQLGGGLCNRRLKIRENTAKREVGINPNGVPKRFKVPEIMKGVEKRPYLAMFYASLLDVDGQKLEAIAVLEDFLTSLQKSPSPKEPAFWYEQRVRGVLNNFYDSYLEQNRSRTPRVVLDTYLTSLRSYTSLMENLATVKKENANFFPLYKLNNVEGKTLSSDRFSHDPGFQLVCTKENVINESDANASFVNKIKMNAAFISTRSLFARRALEHPEFSSRYIKGVAQIVDQIANIDISCMKGVYGATRTSKQRAEFLLVYSLYQLKLISLRESKGNGHEKWVVNKANLAIEASKMAREILRPLLDNNSSTGPQTKNSGSKYLAKLANSAVKELDSKLARLISSVDQQVKVLQQ